MALKKRHRNCCRSPWYDTGSVEEQAVRNTAGSDCGCAQSQQQHLHVDLQQDNGEEAPGIDPGFGPR